MASNTWQGWRSVVRCRAYPAPVARAPPRTARRCAAASPRSTPHTSPCPLHNRLRSRWWPAAVGEGASRQKALAGRLTRVSSPVPPGRARSLADGAYLKNGMGPDDSPIMTTANTSRGIQPNLGALGSLIPAVRTAAPQHEQNFPWPFTTPSCPHAPQRSRGLMDMVGRAPCTRDGSSRWLHAWWDCGNATPRPTGACWILRIPRRAGAGSSAFCGAAELCRCLWSVLAYYL